MAKVNARFVLDVVKRVDGATPVFIRVDGKDTPVFECFAEAYGLPGRRNIILVPQSVVAEIPKPTTENVPQAAAAPEQEADPDEDFFTDFDPDAELKPAPKPVRRNRKRTRTSTSSQTLSRTPRSQCAGTGRPTDGYRTQP